MSVTRGHTTVRRCRCVDEQNARRVGNLAIAVERGRARTRTTKRAHDLMSRLAERRSYLGSQLSGGEQQMLAIGRALLGCPDLLLLDEPSDGLAPAVVELVGEVLRSLTGEGLALLLVEQDLRLAFAVADRVLVMSEGALVRSAATHDFRHDRERARMLLGAG